MPELPEVQTVVNYIKPHVIGKKLQRIKPLWPKTLHNFNNKDIQSEEPHNHIVNVDRRAKFIILKFKNYILAIHLRMTGKLYFSNKQNFSKHVTAVLEFKNKESLIFEDVRKFGRIYFYKNLNIINSRHGPEPLAKNFSEEMFTEMIKGRKRNIKSLLLDQSFISGLGNIYVDESLWKSRIHSNSISNAIPAKNIQLLYQSIQTILTDAINSQGTTIINFSVNGESGRYANKLYVYGNEKNSCNRCNNKIKKIKVAGRGTYLCTKCQKIYK